MTAETTPKLATRGHEWFRITGCTVAALVVLRVAIGWHFLYEGVWKVESGSFSATPYLTGATGPLSNVFRGMVFDADGLERMANEHDVLYRRIDERTARIIKSFHFDERQQTLLKRFAEQCKHDKDGDSVDAVIANEDYQRELKNYRDLLDKLYALQAKPGKTAFEEERLKDAYSKRTQARVALLAKVEAPINRIDPHGSMQVTPTADEKPADVEFRFTSEQLRRGTIAPPRSQTALIDSMVMWGLTIVGVCLMLGLFTRLACLGAAGFLLMFYLAAPPWPGVLELGPSDGGHYLFVNKNMVELLAVLALATTGVGRWFGLDAFVHAIVGKSKAKAQTAGKAAQASS